MFKDFITGKIVYPKDADCWNQPRKTERGILIYIPFHDGCWNCIHAKDCPDYEKEKN